MFSTNPRLVNSDFEVKSEPDGASQYGGRARAGEGAEPCVPFLSWEWSDPSDQFFSFVSVRDFVNCANPSSADFICPA